MLELPWLLIILAGFEDSWMDLFRDGKWLSRCETYGESVVDF